MNIFYSPRFKENLKRCPEQVKDRLYKQAEYLRKNIRHPSLRAKKYDEKRGVWQARVGRDYRFYFLIVKSSYILLNIKNHPK